MEVKQTENEKRGKFYIELDGVEIAKMEYVYAGADKYIIEHTEVNTAYEGKGIGKQLVSAGVDFARTKQIKIMPLCPYAKAVFSKVDSYKDVLF
ncbi:MAG: GNAT family N-acetyltransferase [Flavipsychrobacter sp.]